ncbi:MAG: substrate-binding domain-containing protein [Bryobacteraceae bacterium]
MSRWMWFLPAAALASLAGCGGSMHSADEKYYLVSAATKMEYWDEAASGVAQAGKQLGVIAQAVGPETYDTKGEHEQFRALLSKKPTGIAVSAGDPATLKDDIDAAIAQGIPVITMDSDAPNSKRLFFIGTDNYKAGLMGGRLVASHLGGKGNVVIFTFPEQPNLKERLQGYRDIFAEHPGIHITEIVDAKGDPGVIFDRTMQAAEKKEPVDAFICLVSIAAPEVADVLTRKQVTGKLVMGMDADQRTLDGIQSGVITATLGQKPFTMAFLAIKMLDDLHHHPPASLLLDFARDSFSPLPTFVDTGVTLIDKSNIAAYLQTQKAAKTRK